MVSHASIDGVAYIREYETFVPSRSDAPMAAGVCPTRFRSAVRFVTLRCPEILDSVRLGWKFYRLIVIRYGEARLLLSFECLIRSELFPITTPLRILYIAGRRRAHARRRLEAKVAAAAAEATATSSRSTSTLRAALSPVSAGLFVLPLRSFSRCALGFLLLGR